jgi:hypothetical protein
MKRSVHPAVSVHLAEVQMWVFEEYVKLEDGKWIRPARGAQPPEGKTWVDEGYEPLTEVINRLNENVIYLPGIKLPKSIIAQPDIKKCVTGATMMVFVIPHNFLAPIVPKMEASAATHPTPHTPHHRHHRHHRHLPCSAGRRPEKCGPIPGRKPNLDPNPSPNPSPNPQPEP